VESRTESHRVRKITLFYYLEDDTISLNEEKIKNSGLPAGTLLKRHRIENLSLDSIRVGSAIELFGQTYYICDADGFTRSYYESIGISQPPASAFPDDGFGRRSKIMHQKPADFVPLSRAHCPVNSAKTIQFLANDGKVCRFFATCVSEPRKFIILFYLSDNTVEVRESYQPNSGYDNCSVFFKRGHVPQVSLAGIRIGQTCDLVSRKFLVCDADKFTRDWFEKTWKIVLGPAVVEHRKEEEKHTVQEEPPYTGYGSWEDSLGSVGSLNPKPPKRDLIKLFSNEGKTLRFFCRFTNPCPEDSVRRFVITFYLADDHLMIFEPPIRNSGILGGKFLEKGVYMNNTTGELVKASDFAIGKEINIVRSSFTVETCDEYTDKFLKRSNGSSTNESEIDSIAQKICEKLYQIMHLVHDTFLKVEKNGKAIVTIDKFREILTRFGFFLTDNDSLRVMQRFDKEMRGFVSHDEFCRVIAEWSTGPLKDHHDTLMGIDQYTTVAKRALDESTEADVAKRALMDLTNLLYSREGFDKRFMFELNKIAKSSGKATAPQIRQALGNLGHQFMEVDIQRCVRFHNQKSGPDAVNAPVDIFKFINTLSVVYHKLST
jgi:EF-hand domain-containing protein 1